MSRIFRRALTTFPPLAAPGPSSSSTLPSAVRRRRAELHPAVQTSSPLTDPSKFVGADAEAFPTKLEAEFQSLRGDGLFKGEEQEAREAFLKANQAWRSRVRGGRGKVVDEELTTSVSKAEFFARADAVRTGAEIESDSGARDTILGQRIYLPNVQIRLMRNHTPAGEAYNPNVATFRIPPSMTKHDLRSYLSAVYGLDVTFIRTDNYIAPIARHFGGELRRQGGSRKNYKRAVVGLKEPFQYPDDVDEMRAGTWGGYEAGEEQAKAREQLVDGEYAIEQSKDFRKGMQMKMHKGWRWRASTHDNAGNTVREIMRRRAEREKAIADEVAASYAAAKQTEN